MSFLGTAWLSGFYITSIYRRGITRLINLHHVAPNMLSTTKNGLLGKSSVKYNASEMSNNAGQVQSSPKPPNVLIYTGSCDNEGERFEKIRENLLQSLSRDSYVIYKLEEDQMEGHPWFDNAALLVIDTDKELTTSVFKTVFMYLVNGGKVLGLRACTELCGVMQELSLKPCEDQLTTRAIRVTASGLEEVEETLELQCEPYFFEVTKPNTNIKCLAVDQDTGMPILVEAHEGQGVAILSLLCLLTSQQSTPKGDETSLFTAILRKLGMKCDPIQEIPNPTPAFLMAEKKHKSLLMQSLQRKLTDDGLCEGKDLSLHFFPSTDTTGIPPVTDDTLPVIIPDDESCKACAFDWDMYKKHLTSKILGKVVLYTDVIQSTHTVFDGNHTFVYSIPDQTGVAMVARQQIKGKGRSGNMWLSPIGCMMFSLQVKIKFGTELGSRLPYLQHIASLSFVEAVRDLPGYEDIDIRLKWPNDIYCGREVKIGGVLVTSAVRGNALNAAIGMGVNVTNSEPTICINDMIKHHNTEYGTTLEPLPLEQVLARTISYMESLITEFQEKGKDVFLKKYYKRWLHGGSQVTLNITSPEEVTIVGLDDYGFLSVQRPSGEVCSVQPDGNTFDMLKNLIQIKN